MKFSELPTTNDRGRPLEPVENGVVDGVSIGNDDHGGLTAWLFISGGGWSCGFGGHRLGVLHNRPPEVQGNLDRPGHCAEFIVRCLWTLGAGNWEELKGKPVRVLSEGLGGGIVAIGHFLKDEWFCPQVEFEEAPKKVPGDVKQLSINIELAFRKLGMIGGRMAGDLNRWSPSDLATDLAAELINHERNKP